VKKLSVAIVGCGHVARTRHIPSFLRLKKEIDLCAVCDINYNVAQNIAKEFGISNAYSNLSDMLSKENPDVVDVCTPPKVHASLAIESMEYGSHVLLEKPMAPNISDCDRMISTVKKTGQKLSIIHNQLFYPPFLKAQELINKDEIGKLTSMTIQQLSSKNAYMQHKDHWIHKLNGGFLGETGPHVIYMSLAFLKNVKNVKISARKTLEYPWVLYDDYRILLEGENMTSSIFISHSNNYPVSDISLYGREGMINMDLQSMLLMRYKRGNLKPLSVGLSSLSVALQMIQGILFNTLRLTFNRPMLGHDIMIKKFVDSILNDKQVPVTPEEGRETIRVMGLLVDKLDSL